MSEREGSRTVEEQLSSEHEPPVDDHVEPDVENQCGYCGKHFASIDSRIERTIYGKKWVFCSDECYENFKDASNYQDPDPDMMIEEEDTGFEVDVKFSGPEIDDE